MKHREEIIGGCRLILSDCESVLPTLSKADLCLTDPPYGIGEHGGACRTRGKNGYSKHEKLDWDNERPSNSAISLIMQCADEHVIWGGNYFADQLPPKMGWLYWRKLMGGDFSDGELAWTSRDGALKEFVRCPKGMNKTHPCEKPVDLIQWCLGFFPEAKTVIDPYMGSGTTGVICAMRGLQFIGIEREETYFTAACKRIREVYEYPGMFAGLSKPIQPDLLEGDA